jgi:hypothetical protein
MGTAGARRAASRRRCGHLLSRLDANLARLDERPASRGSRDRSSPDAGREPRIGRRDAASAHWETVAGGSRMPAALTEQVPTVADDSVGFRLTQSQRPRGSVASEAAVLCSLPLWRRSNSWALRASVDRASVRCDLFTEACEGLEQRGAAALVPGEHELGWAQVRDRKHRQTPAREDRGVARGQ